MKVEGNSVLSFWGNSKLKQPEELIQAKAALGISEDKKIILGKIHTETVQVDLSDEGLSAAEKLQYLRKAVQEMPDSGARDYEALMWLREVFPKVQMDPVGTLYQEMRELRYGFLEQEKEDSEVASLENTVSSWMKAYVLRYDELIKSHADGSRDVYVQNPGNIEQYGEYIFHKVDLKEDMQYLNEAFEKAVQNVDMVAQIQENRWNIQHIFHGKEDLGVTLPKDYGKKLQKIMENAKQMFEEKYDAGGYTDTNSMLRDMERVASKLLKEDEVFWNSMDRLFSMP